MYRAFRTASLVAASVYVAAMATASAQQITIGTNATEPLRLDRSAASIVVGNPQVADVTVHDDKLVFITGKTFGTTNLLIFDRSGNAIFEGDIAVTRTSGNALTVNRAGQNNSYDCVPECRSVAVIGDDLAYFSEVIEQTQAAQGIGQAGQ